MRVFPRFVLLPVVLFGMSLGLAACGDSNPPAEEPAPSAALGDAAQEETDMATAGEETVEDVPPAFAEASIPENPTSEGLHDGSDPGEDLYGRGLYREALEYWEVAAEDEGNAYAAYRLGVEYLDAQVLERDIPTSVRYQQLATELGSAPGMFELAGFYETGIGVQQDIDRAAQLYLQSALRGFPPAQHNVATMFEDGVGVPQDPVRAYMFYALAIAQGFRVNFEQPHGGEELLFVDPIARLESTMSDDDIALAQNLIATFEPME